MFQVSWRVFCLDIKAPTILLVIVDTPEGPCDNGASSKVTVCIVKSVTSSRAFKEKECDEHKSFCQNISLVLVSINTKGLETRQYDQDQGPAVIKR
jgi:hypothetical protein